MATWSKAFTLEFIELFRKQEPLWQAKSKDYHDRLKKEQCFKVLVNKLKEIDGSATRENVQKKIHNLRTVFRREYRKMSASRISGNMSDVYVPKLWYYQHLMFLKDDAEPLGLTTLSLDEDAISSHGEGEAMCSQVELFSQESTSTFDLDSETQTVSTKFESNEPGPSRSARPFRSFKRKRKQAADYTLLLMNKRLSRLKEDDACDIFGKNVACKLRSLCPDQRLLAEKIINDTLFEAQFQSLG